jgi:hypothetical protein
VADKVKRIGESFAKENLLVLVASTADEPDVSATVVKHIPRPLYGPGSEDVQKKVAGQLAIEPTGDVAVATVGNATGRGGSRGGGVGDDDDREGSDGAPSLDDDDDIVCLSDMNKKNNDNGKAKMSKSERKRKKATAKHAAAAASAQEGSLPTKKARTTSSTPQFHTGGSFNPYGEKKKKKHGRK